jgi:hypothetical protein
MGSGGGGTTINYPQQPTYGEGMADAMKAQMQQLLGQGDYAGMYSDAGFAGGNLGDIIAGVEGPIRQQTAQTDTDVLRQTLLGSEKKFQVEKDPKTGKYGITGAEVVKGEDGKSQTAGDGRYQIVSISGQTQVGTVQGWGKKRTIFREAKYSIIDTATGGVSATYGGELYATDTGGTVKIIESGGNYVKTNTRYTPRGVGEILKEANTGLQSIQKSIDDAGGDTDAGAKEFTFNNPYTGEPLEEGQTVTIREGDGMIDLLGDRRKTLGNVPDYAQYVKKHSDLYDQFVKERQSRGASARSIEEFGKEHYEVFGRDEGREMPTSLSETNRMAGFDEQGNFLGLSAMAEDIQRGNLSRQREADLADVERLADRYSAVMEDFAPATVSGITGARDLIEEQKENLTTANTIVEGPSGSTYGGDISAGTMKAASVGDPLALKASTSYDPSTSVSGGTFDAGTSYNATSVADPLKLTAATSYTPSAGVKGESYTAAQAGDPMQLTAATSYDPSASVKGDGYTATAGLEGGNVGADSLRAALLADAEQSLTGGLSERELANISNAARARSTLSGRTFDQQGAIEEAQALVAEDNNRRMQNRAFAGDTLGRESDIQRDDLARGLQAAMQNQAALNRAAEFTASQDMQAQLANQAATNQARQASITAGLSQEALAAQQKQAQEFANQAASNRALEFGASTSMDAQRLNQAATNQALSQGLSAGLSQEALAAQQQQAKAMADASAANQASQFGVSAGMQQEAQANQAALQAQLANQQAANQAAQFGVGAGMEQDALRAQLGQQTNLAQAQMNQQAAAFDADAAQRASQVNQAQKQQAAQFGVGATMDAQRINETLRQQGLGNYINAVGNLSQIEKQTSLDPFQALLGRAGGGSLQAGQGVFGQAGYGLQSGPQYLNPESGLGYISQMAANQASMYGAQLAADATRDAGRMSMFGNIGGGLLGGIFGKK